MKTSHEFRDPVHQFIQVDSDERLIVDSPPVQRLRYIHQLAMSYLVYPGATHRRFEHSLGVMELASQVFDVITDAAHVSQDDKERYPELGDSQKLMYWRRAVRLAGLCHDLGHLPFSHAAEHDMLQPGTSHETLTKELVLDDKLGALFEQMTPSIRRLDVAKLAVGTKGFDQLSEWEQLLSEVIVGDAFGVDRIDYLLRDSHHAGVAYGRFDHHRLIQSLRILQEPANPDSRIGIVQGGIHTAEALLLARYFMFSQVYFHRDRVIYDRHLADFLRAYWSNEYPKARHLEMTDNEVLTAIRAAAGDPKHPGHRAADLIWNRRHYKELYENTPDDVKLVNNPAQVIGKWAESKWTSANVQTVDQKKAAGRLDFAVQTADGTVANSLEISQPIRELPDAELSAVFVAQEVYEDALGELGREKQNILQTAAI